MPVFLAHETRYGSVVFFDQKLVIFVTVVGENIIKIVLLDLISQTDYFFAEKSQIQYIGKDVFQYLLIEKLGSERIGAGGKTEYLFPTVKRSYGVTADAESLLYALSGLKELCRAVSGVTEIVAASRFSLIRGVGSVISVPRIFSVIVAYRWNKLNVLTDKIKTVLEANASRPIPAWLDLNSDNLEAKVLALPERDQIGAPVEEHLIVEFYSK